MFHDRITDSMNIWLISIIRKVMLELLATWPSFFFFFKLKCYVNYILINLEKQNGERLGQEKIIFVFCKLKSLSIKWKA